MKPKAGIFIGYSKSSRRIQIYSCRTKKIIETIHVKFDELTAMASEHNCLEPGTNHFQDNDSSTKDTSIHTKEDLDNLSGPMYGEYFKKRSFEVSINSAAHTTLNNQDTPSSSSIIVEDNEAPPLVSYSKEQISPVSNNEADELIQEEDYVDLDGNTLLSPYHTLMFKEVESSSTAEDPSNMQVITPVNPQHMSGQKLILWIKMILKSIEQGPLLWPTVKEDGVTRLKKYSELSAAEVIQADCDVKATNIILQGLPLEVYALVSTHKVAKELWERI
nr:hypothetical protein [Tanacetum cinerariifolium]